MNEAVDADPLAEFPELASLITIRDAGWRFLPLRYVDGQPDQLDGFREWAGKWLDAIRIRSATDAMAIRAAPGERPSIVWETTGTLADVVAGLLSLPTPNQPNAPRLVRGNAPTLWTP